MRSRTKFAQYAAAFVAGGYRSLASNPDRMNTNRARVGSIRRQQPLQLYDGATWGALKHRYGNKPRVGIKSCGRGVNSIEIDWAEILSAGRKNSKFRTMNVSFESWAQSETW